MFRNILDSLYLLIRSNARTITFYLIIAIIAYFQLFYKLDELTIRVWDEGKNAVSALEMMKNGKIFIRYYEGIPDMWGLKPPLLTWCQVISMNLIGTNEMAIRLPSVLSAIFIILIVFRYLKKEYFKPIIGVIFAFILLTSDGYLEGHIAKSGDHDSMLVLFLAVQLIYFYKYIRYPDKRNTYIFILTIAFILAALTKGIASLFFLPGFFLYTLVSKKIGYILSHKQFYLGIFFFLFVVIGYYIIRELNNPGYLSEVWNNELFLRYTDNSPNYPYSYLSEYFFYIKNIVDKRYVPWIYFLPIALFFILKSKNDDIKHFTKYLLFPLIALLVILSFGTKNLWYDAPVYPILGLINAIGIYCFFVALFSYKIIHPVIKYGIAALISFAFTYFPIKQTKTYTYATNEKPWDYEIDDICYYLREHIETGQNIGSLHVSYINYHSHILFYMDILNSQGNELNFTNYEDIKTPLKVIASEKKVKDYIESNYQYQKTDSFRTAIVYNILP